MTADILAATVPPLALVLGYVVTLTVAWLSGTPSADIVEDALVQCGAVGG